MAHRKNDRPTFVYWLFDSLTNVPFYCGKTVNPLDNRLRSHKYDARRGKTPVYIKLRELGENVRIQLIDTVPPDGDWGACETLWIARLHSINPLCCNVTSGGQGCPGRIVSAETRAKLSAMFKGKLMHSPETRAKLSAIGMGKKRSRESVEKGRAKQIGRKLTPEQCVAISERNKARFAGEQGEALRRAFGGSRKGTVASPETRAKQRAAKLGTKRTPEQRAAISAASTERKMSPEAIARSVAARLGRKRTPEQRARMSSAHKGKKWSQAQRDAIPAGLLAAWKRRKNEGRIA